MNHSEIKVTYVAHMGDDLTPVNAARISFGKQSDEMSEGDRKLINYLAKHNHMTPFEHQTLTVVIECPLYIRSQIHRHRTFAYNEISRRYTAESLSFYIPPVDDIRSQARSNKQASGEPIPEDHAALAQKAMELATQTSLEVYEKLLALGVSREQARGILPQNLDTKFYMTGNLRNWTHFLALRLDGHAQKEVRMVAEQVRALIENIWPESYKALSNGLGEAQ